MTASAAAEPSLAEPLLNRSDDVETSHAGGASAREEKWQLEEPLFPELEQAHGSFANATLSLAKVILGSSMLVMPMAFKRLGIAVALTVLALVSVLTLFSISGLTRASLQLRQNTYSKTVRAACGKPARWGILFAVLTNCLGMCVALLIIFSDILIGSASNPGGLINDFFPGLPADSMFNSRPTVLALLVLVLLLPLGLQRSLASLGIINAVGVAAVGAFAASTCTVAVAAHMQGVAFPVPILPDWEYLGSSLSQMMMGCLSIAPILLNANICHQSVFPTMGLLKPFTVPRFDWVVALALALANMLYAAISITSLMAFGPGLDDDALNNLSDKGLTPLIGADAAQTVSVLVRVAYFVSLVGSFILQLYPLRETVLELIMSGRMGTEEALFVPVTLALMAISYIVAVLVPSVWFAISLVGSACSTLMGFIFPGLVILAVAPARGEQSSGARRAVTVGLAGLLVALGSVLFVNGFYNLA